MPSSTDGWALEEITQGCCGGSAPARLGKVKETSFKDSLATGPDDAQSSLRLQHFLPATKQPSARGAFDFLVLPRKLQDQVWVAAETSWVQPWSPQRGFGKDNFIHIPVHAQVIHSLLKQRAMRRVLRAAGQSPFTTHASGSCCSEHHFLIKNDHCKS